MNQQERPSDGDTPSLREDLFRVINHYADLAQLAKKGEVDPLSQIGKIVKKTVPYLLLTIRDMLPALEADQISYYEALNNIIRAGRTCSDPEMLMDSKNEIQRIEEGKRIFIFAVKWVEIASNLLPSPSDMDAMKRRLRELNKKYIEKYASEEDTTILIPCFFSDREAESRETTIFRMADLVRRAVLELHHLMISNEPSKRLFFFTSNSRLEIEEDIMTLSKYLFRCGWGVERIATGYYKEAMAAFLNEKLLDYLILTSDRIDTLLGTSNHLLSLCNLDFASFYEIRNDYCDLTDIKEASGKIKIMKSKNRRGGTLLKKLLQLMELYSSRPLGRLLQGFMLYRYHSAFGDYHGIHRVKDPRVAEAVKLYKPLLDKQAVEQRAEKDLEQSGKLFSSKTREEMSGLLKLIMDSLENPGKVIGKKVKILGDISSGAMGKVCIGIFRDQIVALKKVKSQISSTLGDPVALLEYEAAMHARVQSEDQHPYIVEYYGLIEQDDEKLLLNGYYPSDNLTHLVERNWQEKYKQPFNTESKITLGTLEAVINQLLECLRVFRAKGIVHRDLKTDNILYMVDEYERLNRIKVIDFGVALAAGPGAQEDLFKGKVVGTFAYMAPEQARGKSVFESDLYSAGAILTVMLTGQLPLHFPKTKTRQDLIEQIRRIERDKRPRLTELNSWLKKNTIFEQIAAIVESMLELDPLQRPTLEEVQGAFNGIFQHIGNLKHNLSIFYVKN